MVAVKELAGEAVEWLCEVLFTTHILDASKPSSKPIARSIGDAAQPDQVTSGL